MVKAVTITFTAITKTIKNGNEYLFNQDAQSIKKLCKIKSFGRTYNRFSIYQDSNSRRQKKTPIQWAKEFTTLRALQV